MGFGLVGLHRNSIRKASCLLSLGISQPWEGQSLQDQQGPKMSKHYKIQKIKN